MKLRGRAVVVRSPYVRLVLLTVVGSLSLSCGSPAPPRSLVRIVDDAVIAESSTTGEERRQAIDAILRARCEPFESPGDLGERPAPRGEGRLILTRMLDEMPVLKLDPEVVWPGSLVLLSDLDSGSLTPLTLPRGEATLTLSGQTLNRGKYDRGIEKPTYAEAQNEIQDLLSTAAPQTTAARVAYFQTRGHTLEQALLELDVVADWLQGAARASFGKGFEDRQTHVLLKFVQLYYDVSFAPPARPSDVFAASVQPEELELALGPVDRNVGVGYISNVSYGRVLLVLVSSDYSDQEVSGAIEAYLSNPILEKAGIELGGALRARQKQILDHSDIRILAFGGGAPEVIDLVGDKMGKLREYFERGKSFAASSPGLPIAYRVRRLGDNQLVRLVKTVEFVPTTDPPRKVNLEVRFTHVDIFENGSAFWFDDTWSLESHVNGSHHRVLWDRKPNIYDHGMEDARYRGPGGETEYRRYPLTRSDRQHVVDVEVEPGEMLEIRVGGQAHDNGLELPASEIVLGPEEVWGIGRSHRIGGTDGATAYYIYFRVRELN